MPRKFRRETPAVPTPPPARPCPTCGAPLERDERCARCRLWVGRSPLRFCKTVHGEPTVDVDGGCWRCKDFPLPKLRHEIRNGVGVWVETDEQGGRPLPERIRQLLDETFGARWREEADAAARRKAVADQARLRED